MASAVVSRTRLACSTQVRHISLGKGGWLGKFFEKSKATPDPNIATPNAAAAAAVSPLATAGDASLTKKSTKRKPLSPESKTLRFQQNIEFMTPRLQPRADRKLSKIAQTTWVRTLAVCQTEEDLRKVMELFPLWRAKNNRFDHHVSNALISRCIMLKKPEIAIEVFGNYAKYNVPLTLTGARKLLQATYETHPLVVPITISSLFATYKLPPVDKDLPCCSMLLSACLADGSKQAGAITRKLYHSLKLLLRKVEPQTIPQTQEKGEVMYMVWTKWALRKVEEQLVAQKNPNLKWLHSWRVKSGHIPDDSASVSAA